MPLNKETENNQLVGFCREKNRVWKLRRPRKLGKDKQHIMVRKREGRHRPLNFFLVFCCVSNLLVLWVASLLNPHCSTSPKLGLTNIRLFTSSLLVWNYISLPNLVSPLTSLKYVLSSSYRLSFRGPKHPFPLVPHLRRFLNPSFFSSDFKSPRDLWPGYFLLLYIFFLFIQHQFSISHSITLHMQPVNSTTPANWAGIFFSLDE